jgi:putative membrane protein
MATISTLAPAALAAHPHGWHGGGWWLFPLFPILFFGFWFCLIFFVIRPLAWRRRGFGPMGYCGPGGAAYGWHPNSGAEAVLAERFARGEIDETDYRARLEVLRVRR